MPIGNQEIWDKGIGAGATNVVFGQQPQQTNFNPGALGADPNAQPAATTAQPAQTGDSLPDFEAWAENRMSNNGQARIGERGLEVGSREEYDRFSSVIQQLQTQLQQAQQKNDQNTIVQLKKQIEFYKKQLMGQNPASAAGGDQVSGVKSNPNNPKLQTGSGKLMSG